MRKLTEEEVKVFKNVFNAVAYTFGEKGIEEFCRFVDIIEEVTNAKE